MKSCEASVRKNRKSAVLGLFLLSLFSVPVYSQVAGGTFSGAVTDPTGAVVPKAVVNIRNLDGNQIRIVNTNQDGVYTAPDLVPGPYELSVSATGFSTAVVSGLNLTVGAEQEVNVSLKIGSAQQTVEVNAAPAVDLATSSVSEVVGSKTVRELPLNGRDWTQLAALQPGISVLRTQPTLNSGRGQRGYGEQMTVAGARPQQNNYRLDGISINDYANGSPGSVLGADLGVEAVDEFSVLSSSYPAEYGRSSGGIINAISRSGTNEFHGSAYDFLRNSALDARNFFDAGKPPFKRNQFGAAAGGPILKNRTFFFANFEGLRQSLGVTTVDTVPSLAARNGQLASGPITVNPLVKPYLAFFPLPNGPVLGNGDDAIYSFAGQQITTENFGTGTIQHKLTSSDTFFGTFLYDNSDSAQPDEFNNKLLGSSTHRYLVTAKEDHIFTPQVFNSLRAGFNRDVALVGASPTAINPIAANDSLGFVPGAPAGKIQISGLTTFTGGLNTGSIYDFHWNSIQVYDDAFISAGNHSIKFGGGLERIDDNMIAGNNLNGTFQFGSLASFLTNNPRLLTTALPQALTPRGIRQSVFGLYVQDDIRLRPNLTVNVGVRYEPTTVPSEVQGKLSTLRNPTDPPSLNHLGSPLFANPTLKNFSPRVGFSWDPFGTGKTAIRAGFGMYDNLPLPYLFEIQSLFGAPFFLNGSYAGLPQGSFPSLAYNLVSAGTSTLRYNYIQPNPPRSYVLQWNMNIQRDLSKDMSGMISYLGSRGVHQPFRTDDMDIVLPTLTPQGYAWPLPIGSGTRLNPNVGLINGLMWGGDSYYEALELQLKRRLGRGPQIQASYSWSKSIDTGSASVTGDTFANSLSSLPWFNLKLNRALSDFDIRQSFTLNYLWAIPAPRRSDALGWAAGGWQVGGIFLLSSGIPFSVILGGDPLGQKSSDSTGSADVPNFVNGPGCSSPVNPGNPNQYIKVSCFSFPNPVNIRGNLGRNTLIGPGLANLDFSLFKNNYIRKISETLNVQFRAEIFNILNRANFAPPLNNNVIFNQDGTSVGGAGLITSLQVPARQLQFAIKVIW